MNQEWDLHSYNIFLTAKENGYSPFSMTTYDITRGRKEIYEKRERREHEGRFSTKYATFEEWSKHYLKGKNRNTGKKHKKTDSYYTGMLKHKNESIEAGRRHKEELAEIIKRIIEPEMYNSDALFAMQKWFERMVEHHLKWHIREPAGKNEIYAETNTEHYGNSRRFEWKYFSEIGELRYWIEYEQGKIINKSVWGLAKHEGQFSEDAFPLREFEEKIKSLGVWE